LTILGVGPLKQEGLLGYLGAHLAHYENFHKLRVILAKTKDLILQQENRAFPDTYVLEHQNMLYAIQKQSIQLQKLL